jgi:serine/threonine protein kinase
MKASRVNVTARAFAWPAPFTSMSHLDVRPHTPWPRASFIDLYDGSRPLGRYDVPKEVSTCEGRSFWLQGATKAGGNALVFAAVERVSGKMQGKPTALKFLKQMNQPRVDRFENEIRVLKELSSPYISSFFAAGKAMVTAQAPATGQREVPWVAIPMGAANFRQHVEEHGALTVQQLKGISPGMRSAVEHLHEKGFIHRDIKPDSFVWCSATSQKPMMIDFGIAKRQGEDVSARPMDTFTKAAEFVGPVFFSSPALIEYSKRKAHPVDYRSDIFQLGKVFWYLGTGKVSAAVPSKKECPAGGKLRDLVLGMVDDDPDCRPQSLKEVRDALSAI